MLERLNRFFHPERTGYDEAIKCEYDRLLVEYKNQYLENNSVRDWNRVLEHYEYCAKLKKKAKDMLPKHQEALNFRRLINGIIKKEQNEVYLKYYPVDPYQVEFIPSREALANYDSDYKLYRQKLNEVVQKYTRVEEDYETIHNLKQEAKNNVDNNKRNINHKTSETSENSTASTVSP